MHGFLSIFGTSQFTEVLCDDRICLTHYEYLIVSLHLHFIHLHSHFVFYQIYVLLHQLSLCLMFIKVSSFLINFFFSLLTQYTVAFMITLFFPSFFFLFLFNTTCCYTVLCTCLRCHLFYAFVLFEENPFLNLRHYMLLQVTSLTNN